MTYTPGQMRVLASLGLTTDDFDRMLQDVTDGAALRRLREATERDESGLPEWDLFPEVEGWCVYCSPLPDKREGWFHGATIAEAADKCREAL